MANWYVSTTKHTAITQWAATTAYSVGDIRRQLAAPSYGQDRAFRCTTAGTSGGSEPAWNTSKGATTADNTVVWTEVTGNETYGWSAPHARFEVALESGYGWSAAGDTIYLGHDHAETYAGSNTFSSQGTAISPQRVICVSTAGSVPPVSADLATTASITFTGAVSMSINGTFYCYGVKFVVGSGSSAGTLNIVNAASSTQVYENCAFSLPSTASGNIVHFGNGPDRQAILINTTLEFGATGNGIGQCGNLVWKNTPNALVGATFPTTLFAGTNPTLAQLDGVDLSALGSGKTIFGVTVGCGRNFIKNCKLGSSVTISGTQPIGNGPIDLLISDSADTHNRQERYSAQGTLSTETTIVRTSGASDGDTSIAWKVITTTSAKWGHPFECFEMGIWNTAVGSSKTATVEIVNDGTTLQDDDIWMDVEYLGTSGSPLASKASTRSADVLNAGTNLTTSGATWTTTGLSSPVKQYMQATFTPQEIGMIRIKVYVAKASKTIYIDPKITIA